MRHKIERFVRELETISSTFRDLSWVRDSVEPGASNKTNNLISMNETQWNDFFVKDQPFFLMRTLSNNDPVPGKLITLVLILQDPISIRNFPYEGSALTFIDIPKELKNFEILQMIMKLGIEILDIDKAELLNRFFMKNSRSWSIMSDVEQQLIRYKAHLDLSAESKFWYQEYKKYEGGVDYAVWRLWLRNHDIAPIDAGSKLEPWQSVLTCVEDEWHGGTLRTWSEFAPWSLPREADWAAKY